MKKLIPILMISLSFSACAALSEDAFIRGKIGSKFDNEKVQVTDSLGQTYDLPKSAFPKDFKFKQGEPFAIEVSDKVLDQVKVIKK